MASSSGQGVRRRSDAAPSVHATTLLERASNSWSRAGAPHWAAALAFHTCLAMALVALEVLVWGATLWGGDAMQGLVAARLRGVIGSDVAAALQALLASTVSHAWMPVVGALGAVGLLLCSVGLAAQWRTAFNALAGASALPGLRRAGGSHPARDALWVFLATTGAGASLVLATVIAHVSSAAPGLAVPATVLDVVATTAVFSLVFVALLRVLSDTPPGRGAAWAGAALAGVALALGQAWTGWMLASTHATALEAALATVVVPLGIYAGVLALLAGRALAAAIDAHPLARVELRRRGDLAAIVEQPLPHAVAAPTSLAAARARTRVTPLMGRHRAASAVMPAGTSAVLLHFPDLRQRRQEPRG